MSFRKIVAFDFDGVIVDSIKLSYDINKELMPDLDYEDWRTWSNGNFHEIVRKRNDIKFLFNDDNYRYYRKRYNKEVLKILPIAGINNILNKMNEKYTLVVISSNSQKSIELYLKKHNLIHYFQDLLGEETSQSKVEKFKFVIKKYNTNSENLLLITDSLGDIKEANELNIKSLAVLWGIHDHSTLNLAAPHSIIARPEEILDSVESIWI
ncbi:MAG: HAD hydrolase-like protein [Candidatus Saccharimonadales bacterium]